MEPVPSRPPSVNAVSPPELKPSFVLSVPLSVADVPSPITPAESVTPLLSSLVGLRPLSVCRTCVALFEGTVPTPVKSATVGRVAPTVESLPLPVLLIPVAPVPVVNEDPLVGLVVPAVVDKEVVGVVECEEVVDVVPPEVLLAVVPFVVVTELVI